MPERLEAFLSEWSAAELAGDTKALAILLADGFVGVGPLGFILPRPAWLDRHQGGLVYEQFALEEIEIHLHRDVAVVTARNNAHGNYQGHPIPEALRTTLVIVSTPDALRLAAVHMSFVAGTQGSPPLPGPSDAVESRDATNAEGGR